MEGAVPGARLGLNGPGPSRPDLIETLGWDGARLVRGERHLARLARSAALLGYPCDREACGRALREGRTGPVRLRLVLDPGGRVTVTEGPMPAPAASWRVAVHPERLDPEDPWLRVKSTNRALYDRARAALPQGLDEWLFLNRRGEACEGTITTLFFDRGEGWRTPPLACGCLPGVLREAMLERGLAREEALGGEELGRVRLAMGNSLRGLVAARLALGEA